MPWFLPQATLAHVHLPLVYLRSPCLLSLCCKAVWRLLESRRFISLKLILGFLSGCVVSVQVISSLLFYVCALRFDTIIHPWQHTFRQPSLVVVFFSSKLLFASADFPRVFPSLSQQILLGSVLRSVTSIQIRDSEANKVIIKPAVTPHLMLCLFCLQQ